MMRLWFVFVMALCVLPVTAVETYAQNEQAAPASQSGPIESTLQKVEEFFTPPAADPALAGEPVTQEIANAMHEGVGAEHASSGGLPQFDPTWYASQAFWLVITFSILYAIFARRTLPNLSSIIENRKNHIQSDLEQAENLTSQAETVQGAYEKSLSGARERSVDMLNDIHTSMQNKKNEQTEHFRVRSENEVRGTEERLEAAKNKAMAEISDIVADVAAQAVEKIIGVPADTAKARTVVSRLKDAA